MGTTIILVVLCLILGIFAIKVASKLLKIALVIGAVVITIYLIKPDLVKSIAGENRVIFVENKAKELFNIAKDKIRDYEKTL